MASLTLKDVAEKMKSIDYTMLTTRTEGDELSSRPMSNNSQVDYDGDSWFFAYDDARHVADIRRNPKVGLSFAGKPGLLGKPGVFIAVEGRAELTTDPEAMKRHWTPDIERYFPQGLNTPGIVLIKVSASRIHAWDGEDEVEIPLGR